MKSVIDVGNESLNDIFGKLKQLQQLQQKTQPYLPKDLQANARVANYRNGILVFALSSAVWATRFRYAIPELLENFRKKADLYHLSSIQFYIEPAFHDLFG